MKFTAFGHKNILGTHPTTIEFTKEKELSLNGNCIVGVNSDFNLKEIKDFIAKKKSKCGFSVKITIEVNGIKEDIIGILNPNFNDDKEIVIRKSDFVSKRTLVFGADKGALDLKRELIRFIKKIECRIYITLI